MELEKKIAQALIEIDGVGFRVNDPITFKTGIVSPVYCDNRKFPFTPSAWKQVIEGFADMVKRDNIQVEVVAGVEAAGIPHSAALGFFIEKPSVFVRKQAKEHGTKKMVEGGSVEGKKVILIEDLVTTGSSSLAAVEALRNEGAIVTDMLVIVTYGFPESEAAFKEAGVTLHALTNFPTILKEAIALGKISEEDAEKVTAWTKDPYNWSNN